MRGREAVGRAWIVDFLGALDQPGRLLRRVFDRNDLVIFTVFGNARRGVRRIVLATTGRPPYASALTAPATVTYRTPRLRCPAWRRTARAPSWRSRSTGPSGCACCRGQGSDPAHRLAPGRRCCPRCRGSTARIPRWCPLPSRLERTRTTAPRASRESLPPLGGYIDRCQQPRQ